jgi:4-hydroxythreonine-4-phosphate dehydrogenase
MHGGRPLAVTMGEPAGIGPELVAMAWRALRGERGSAFICLADPGFLRNRLRAAGIDAPVAEIGAPGEATPRFADALPVLPLRSRVERGEPGRPDVADCPAVLEAIHTAVALVQDGACRALVRKRSICPASAFPATPNCWGSLQRAAAVRRWP